jgi:hypothetical protein
VSTAACDFILDGDNALQRGHFPWEVNGTEFREDLIPVTVTAGLEKLAQIPAATTAITTAASSLASEASITPVPSGSSPSLLVSTTGPTTTSPAQNGTQVKSSGSRPGSGKGLVWGGVAAFGALAIL